jgi:hypothetical protein
MSQEMPTSSAILSKIKSSGYWEVNIHPVKFNPNQIPSLQVCKNLVESSKVRLRGWDYPHISKFGITGGTDYVESLTDFEPYVELWRMFQSGQFVHLFGFREDRWGPIRIFWSEKPTLEPGYGLEFISTIYTISEIFEFAKRLAQKGIFNEELNLTINMHNTKNRRIITTEIRKMIHDSYLCNIDNINIDRVISTKDMVANSGPISIDVMCHIFERFNWFNVPRQVLIEERDKFIKGIYA